MSGNAEHKLLLFNKMKSFAYEQNCSNQGQRKEITSVAMRNAPGNNDGISVEYETIAFNHLLQRVDFPESYPS